MTPVQTLPAPDSVDDTALAVPATLRRISIVIPCLNEEESLPQLRDRLLQLRDSQRDRLELEAVFVDDGSTDNTRALVGDLFEGELDFVAVAHPENRGIGAAILTGIKASTADTIVTIDADCTFNPLDIPLLLEQLVDGVSVVIGSPYQVAGMVDHVPAWRIALSRMCSRMYRSLFRNRITCYTGCFRAFSADEVRQFSLDNNGFVGVVELLWKLDGLPGQFVEVPVTLSNRKYGRSKMKTLRAMALHFLLMCRIATGTIRRPGPANRNGKNIHKASDPRVMTDERSSQRR